MPRRGLTVCGWCRRRRYGDGRHDRCQLNITNAEYTGPCKCSCRKEVKEGMHPLMARVVNSRSYHTTFPNGRSRQLQGDVVKKLPHWKHCDVQVDYPYITFNIRRFKFGRSGGDPMVELRQLEAQLQQKKRDLELIESQATEMEARTSGMKGSIVPLLKRSHKFSYERLREVLLADPTILDVKMPGEPWLKSSLFGLNEDQNNGYSTRLMVTFAGAIINTKQGGGVPLPPTQVCFGTSGGVWGGPLCIHPHMRPAGMCTGNIGPVLKKMAQGDGDIFSAIDLMRVFSLSYHWESPLNTVWGPQAWDWWCGNVSLGWPTEEPFDKPWLSVGIPLRDNITGEMVALADFLGAVEPEPMLKAMHIGSMAYFYDKTKHGKDLSVNVYQPGVMITGGAPAWCVCGRPDNSEETRLELGTLCSCHTTRRGGHEDGTRVTLARKCVECGQLPGRCLCTYALAACWTAVPAGSRSATYRCEQRSPDGSMQCLGATRDYPTSNYVQTNMYRLNRYEHRFDNSGAYYNGPHYVCEEHWLLAVTQTDVAGAVAPLTLATFEAENYVDPDGSMDSILCPRCQRDTRFSEEDGVRYCRDCGVRYDEPVAEEIRVGLPDRMCGTCGRMTPTDQQEVDMPYCRECGLYYADEEEPDEVDADLGDVVIVENEFEEVEATTNTMTETIEVTDNLVVEAARTLRELLAEGNPTRTIVFGGEAHGTTQPTPEPEGPTDDVVRGADETGQGDAGVRETQTA